MDEPRTSPASDLEPLSTRELITRVADDSRKLVRGELDLARAELRSDLRAEIKLAAGFGISGLLAFTALGLLFLALVAGLATGMPVWAAALVAAAVALVIAALAAAWGWAKRTRAPLGQTRDSVKETIEWTRHPVD
jgi:uncharacterized membrane protein YqjE